MNVVAGEMSPESELSAETGFVHSVVQLAEPLLGAGSVPERLDDRETAVGLFDVSIQLSGVGPLRDEKPLGAPGDQPNHPQRQGNCLKAISRQQR